MPNKKMAILAILIVLFAGGLVYSRISEAVGSFVKSESQTHYLKYMESPADNPLKGFVSWNNISNDAFPHSLEFYYVPLNMIQLDYNEFDWSPFEKILNVAQASGNQLIVRFYLDCPGEASAIPQFLLDDNVKAYSYTYDGVDAISLCPDYSDQKLQEALVSFIKALGSKYDGDPRIACIQAGLLGFYGEWHTTGYTQWYPSDAVYELIGQTYDDSFSKTAVNIRLPRTNLFTSLNVGYHDDMFAIDTATSFYEELNACFLTNNWKTQMNGGELAPELQNKYFVNIPSGALDWDYSLDLTHATYLLNAQISNYTGTNRDNAIAAAKKLGYDFYVTKAYYEDIVCSGVFKVGVDIENIGVAPFYYPWEVVVAIRDASGKEIYSANTNWDLTRIDPQGGSVVFEQNLADVKLEDNNEYTIYMKVVNPMAGGKQLKFANETQGSDGWLKLGNFTKKSY